MSKYKKGFTLAELMICLLVIAAIAVMIIPNVALKKPKRNKTMLKKAYQLVETVTREAMNDTIICDDSEANVDELPTGFACNTSLGSNLLAAYFARKLNVDQKTLTAQNIDSILPPKKNGFKADFVTSDGINWMFTKNKFCDVGFSSSGSCTYPNTVNPDCPKSTETTSYGCVIVDINGENGPNSYTEGDNTDRFFFYVFNDGKVRIPTSDAFPTAELLRSRKVQ